MRLAAPGFGMGCIKSVTASGSFTVNGVPVLITHPVTVQFGTYSDLDSNGNQIFHVVPPQDGKVLLTEPEVIPGGLLVLVCLSADPSVARLCETAMTSGHTDLGVEVEFTGGKVPEKVTGYRMAAELEDLSTRVVNPGDLIAIPPLFVPEELDAWYLIMTDNFQWRKGFTPGAGVVGVK